ncbi:MAG TPA: hypothetical protein VMF59_07515, partial [Bacteroidota bacterium]|nr:hypothetical protein [Bacteroidota bacterium]
HDAAEETTPAPAVAICPGPNLAFFSRIATLEEMVGHIYGRLQLISVPDRPSLFINELRLYIDYLKKEIGRTLGSLTTNDHRYLTAFRANLQEGIAYYHLLVPKMVKESERYREIIRIQLQELEEELNLQVIPVPALS